MARRTRRRHTAEQKAEALKRHHLQKQEVSTICEDLKLNPSVFYTWQRTLFANAPTALDAPTTGGSRPASASLRRRSRMKLVRQKNTAPEMAVRRVLRELGVRYRTCVGVLPGSPDIANRTQGWAIFVHGCFWHGHTACKLATVPKTNRSFWVTKPAANRERDAWKVRALRRLG